MTIHTTLRLQLSLALVLLSSSAANCQMYTFLDLDTSNDGYSQAYGINNNNIVVGYFIPGGTTNSHAFLYDGQINDLGKLNNFGDSIATGINDNNVVVGASIVHSGSSTPHHAFLYDSSGVHDLGTLGGSYSYANAINASGVVVGFSASSPVNDNYYSPFQYSSGSMTNLSYHPVNGSAVAINNTGSLAGVYSVDTLRQHAFLFNNAYVSGGNGTGIADLGTLGGLNSQAYGINDANSVVGQADINFRGEYHAFISEGTTIGGVPYVGGMRDLGTLGGTFSTAFAVNNSNIVVGSSDIAGGFGTHAFYFSDRQMVDLNNVTSGLNGFVLQSAQAINDKGYIVGYGKSNTGIHAFLLSPMSVPEPCNLTVLISMAASGVVFRKKRASRKCRSYAIETTNTM